MMHSVNISEIMTENVLVARLDYSFSKICRLFFEMGIHHLPVVDDADKVIGILSAGDVLHAFSTRFSSLSDTQEETINEAFTVESLMTSQPFTLRPEDTVAEAVRFFTQHRFHALPIVSDGQLKGIITNNDVLDFIAKRIEIIDSYS